MSNTRKFTRLGFRSHLFYDLCGMVYTECDGKHRCVHIWQNVLKHVFPIASWLRSKFGWGFFLENQTTQMSLIIIRNSSYSGVKLPIHSLPSNSRIDSVHNSMFIHHALSEPTAESKVSSLECIIMGHISTITTHLAPRDYMLNNRIVLPPTRLYPCNVHQGWCYTITRRFDQQSKIEDTRPFSSTRMNGWWNG